MITEFDKNGAVALYKREFAKCVKAQQFESALDYLIKFSEEVENPDFHMACGMLYLLMAQDSDDRELLTMAYRELMMYIRIRPDCAAAYRNLLASVIMRREPAAVFECCDWIKSRGFDTDVMLDELSEAGVELFGDDSDFLYIEGLYKQGEFGLIDTVADTEAQNAITGGATDTGTQTEKPSKIIKFRGAADLVGSQDKVACNDKIIPIKKDCEDFFAGSALDMMTQFSQDNEDYDEFDDDDENDDLFTSMDKLGELFTRDLDENLPSGLRSRVALRSAEGFCEKGEYDKALDALDKIDNDDKQIYYCAECVRAFIHIERKQIKAAHAALDNALSVNDAGALAGTLLCSLYEIEQQYDKIPQTLKQIDVCDYIDADHVYRAMRLALKYCKTDDIIALAQDYIDEFNIMDIRQLYAQVLYNSGKRAEATKEFYKLARIFYDDFNAQYYYLMARAGAEKMPVDEEAPQQALGMIVDSIIGAVQANAIDDEIISSEAFKYSLEAYLTLEYRNDKKTTLLMFDTLRKLAADVRFEKKMREALLSPYVEPIVKAVILSELLLRDDGFLIDVFYRPVSDDAVPTLGEGKPFGCYVAYAFVLMFARGKLDSFIEIVNDVAPILDGDEFNADANDGDRRTVARDTANYLIRTFKRESKRGAFRSEDRIDYALGYTTKTAATQAFKAVERKINDIKLSKEKT